MKEDLQVDRTNILERSTSGVSMNVLDHRYGYGEKRFQFLYSMYFILCIVFNRKDCNKTLFLL